ncbi:MAG: hypothetical protein WCE21_03975 [Candidatus Babeliales bacterium]
MNRSIYSIFNLHIFYILFIGLSLQSAQYQFEECITDHTEIKDTNFDWEYYIEKNQLSNIANEQDAFMHYLSIGKEQNLEYCKSFNITIVLHLYDLTLTDWFIDRINHFIKNNPHNHYSIKITVPVSSNITRFTQTVETPALTSSEIITLMKQSAPYHRYLITEKNAPTLYQIHTYLYKKLCIDPGNIQIIFCENRGVDIGGFFLSLDQIIKKQHPHDFLIKIHSKLETGWRNGLVFFLDMKINKLLRTYECIYTSKYHFPDQGMSPQRIYELQHKFNLQHMGTFNFAGGTMFIVSSKFTDFMAQYHLLKLYKMLNMGKHYRYENAFERLFGCIFDYLHLKIFNP